MKNADMPAMPTTITEKVKTEIRSSTGTFKGTKDVDKKLIGLTKREIFAMHAMQGLMASVEHYDLACPQETARAAVAHADALLKELEK